MSAGVKFQRNYLFTANGNSVLNNPGSVGSPWELQFGSPFTIEFDIARDSYAQVNYANIRIYNLSEIHRNQLLKDQDTLGATFVNQLNIVLNAGYGDNQQLWPVVFKGNVLRGYSVREGTNWITYLEAQDGGSAFSTATTNRVFNTGQSMSEIIREIITGDLLPFGISLGEVSSYFNNQIAAKGQSFSGNTIQVLCDITNSNFFIDNLKSHVLLANDALGGNQVTLNAQSGLLETPIREQSILYVKMLFEPRIVVGSVINLDSITAVNVYNGQYKVISVHHRGTISAAVSGEAITEVGLSSAKLVNLIGA